MWPAGPNEMSARRSSISTARLRRVRAGWARQRGNLGGTFTITAVEAGRRWVSECPVPLGDVVFDHVLEPVAGGRVRSVKRAEVSGGAGPLLLFAPKMRRDAESLAALQRLTCHQ